jgi:hypothetical protein
MSKFMVKIVEATRSPLNLKQWMCRYECGHEGWITRARKPTGKIECTQVHGTLGPKMRLDLEPMKVPRRGQVKP